MKLSSCIYAVDMAVVVEVEGAKGSWPIAGKAATDNIAGSKTSNRLAGFA